MCCYLRLRPQFKQIGVGKLVLSRTAQFLLHSLVATTGSQTFQIRCHPKFPSGAYKPGETFWFDEEDKGKHERVWVSGQFCVKSLRHPIQVATNEHYCISGRDSSD